MKTAENNIRDGFRFLRLFEETLEEVAVETESGEVCEEVRRRVVDRVLNEMKQQRNEMESKVG